MVLWGKCIFFAIRNGSAIEVCFEFMLATKWSVHNVVCFKTYKMILYAKLKNYEMFLWARFRDSAKCEMCLRATCCGFVSAQ